MHRVLLVALVGLVPAAMGCTESEAATPKKTRAAVKVETVEPGGAQAEARYSATIEPETKVDVAFRANGYVDVLGKVKGDAGERALDVGDFVTKGTVLARIKAADYSQKVATARARQAEAKASAKLAEQELERAERLHGSKVVSLAELEAKTAQRDAALASVAAASAQTAEAAVALGDTVLRAPADGVILARRVEEGSLVSPGSVAFVIADTRNVKVTFGAPQALVERLRVGDEITVGLDTPGSERERNLTAKVTRIAPAAEKTGRLFAVESLVPNPTGELRSGSVVSVRVSEEALATDGFVVPLGAVVRTPNDSRGFALFVVEGTGTAGRARLRAVTVGGLVGNGVAVTSGLSAGDRVVTRGAGLLTDGAEAVVLP